MTGPAPTVPAAEPVGPVVPRDERRHTPPPDAADVGWCEVFAWELTGDPAVTIRLVLHRERAWYLAGVVVPGRPVTVVTDLDVPRPTAATSLEVRTTGLWADHNVETPLAHVSVGLEAFGIALDDPADALTDGFGVRVPVGFDLEWEDDRPPVAGLTADRYEAPGRAHGEILLGRDRFEVDGPGSREHSWGIVDWRTPGWWRASIRWADGRHSVARGAGPVPAAGTAVTVGPDGSAGTAGAHLDLHTDDWGLPAAARLGLDGTTFDLEPEACLPVPIPGSGSVLLSTLVTGRHPRTGDVAGRGWLEILT